ncbi:hypothetical protein [Serratia phage vB_SmaM_Hera]|uniref:Uncharacterized protein n=1 Tax=Serratia phage vB_SmaM_Hera TaxID=2777369 RepID=A0A7T3N991_9CAUD|nr:hypothetical protein [Serratia phage vB_SmaM_Hera]
MQSTNIITYPTIIKPPINLYINYNSENQVVKRYTPKV